MKTISRKFAQAAFVVTILSASVAMAGFHSIQGVSIIDSISSAVGDLGYVHNSSDPNEYIGCAVYPSAGTLMGFCAASNTSNVFRSCTTGDPGQVATIRSLREDSTLEFSWYANGACSFVSVRNESQTQPR